ncbi:hypothetical protein GWI33_003742 [Rhynchophorus ferrugineus]|uniref:Uncharacterized protein n=1 Tax=Rhynchophorus ferrugineus TaxID=354439 RepID=A0A834HIJ0_RHYFE|nr:hypothetical protein GWI33_003742 [Rhynchophorus ferrugineus]
MGFSAYLGKLVTLTGNRKVYDIKPIPFEICGKTTIWQVHRPIPRPPRAGSSRLPGQRRPSIRPDRFHAVPVRLLHASRSRFELIYGSGPAVVALLKVRNPIEEYGVLPQEGETPTGAGC